jgi:hypothetical protein
MNQQLLGADEAKLHIESNVGIEGCNIHPDAEANHTEGRMSTGTVLKLPMSLCFQRRKAEASQNL